MKYKSWRRRRREADLLGAPLDLERVDSAALARAGDLVDHEPGEVVVPGWSRSRCVYVLLSGRLEVFTPFDRRRLRPGEMFGAVEAYARPYADAAGSLVAAETSRSLAVPFRSFLALAATDPAFAALVAEELERERAGAGQLGGPG